MFSARLTAGEQAIVADAMEACGEHVDEKAAICGRSSRNRSFNDLDDWNYAAIAPSLGGHGDPQIAFALIGVGLLCVPVLYVAGRSP